MKRWSIIAGMLALFLVFTGVLVGCGAAADDLQNAAGSGESPGSGNWEPQMPENARQGRQLYEVLQTLRSNANEESGRYDKLFERCLTADGKLRSGDETDECVEPLVNSWLTLQALFRDFINGRSTYVDWAQENGARDMPSPPDLPRVPEQGLLPAEIFELGSDQNYTGWLTCVNGLDVEFVFRPAPLEIEAPTS